MAITNGPKIEVMAEGALGDPYLAQGNQLLRMFQALLQANIISMSLGTAPGSPSNGDTYVVGVGGGS